VPEAGIFLKFCLEVLGAGYVILRSNSRWQAAEIKENKEIE